MNTYFATPEKAPEDQLGVEVRIANESAVVCAMLQSVSGLLAVLNEHRQILALNDSFIKTLGINDPEEVLGLRPGEALHCIHADKAPAGCGTTKFCSTCGAAVAIVASLGQDVPTERLCALTVQKGGKDVNVALSVRSQPVTIGGRRFLLLLVHDVTVEHRRAALERTFFHDINNMLTVLVQSCDVLALRDKSELAEVISGTANLLHREVAIQQYLSSVDTGQYRPIWCTCNVTKVVVQLRQFFARHPVAEGKMIEYAEPVPDLVLTTDISALLRVVSNMVLNALEATGDGGIVRVWVEHQAGQVAFCVWNQAAIPDEIRRRLFQRNFSTKAKAGRGIGTFSMKLLGEEVLGGRVTFTSSEKKGTVFRFSHPLGEQNSASNG